MDRAARHLYWCFVGLGFVCSIAVDRAARHLYWCFVGLIFVSSIAVDRAAVIYTGVL